MLCRLKAAFLLKMKGDKTHQRCRREILSTFDERPTDIFFENWSSIGWKVIKENDQDPNPQPVLKVLYFPSCSQDAFIFKNRDVPYAKS